MTAGRATTEPSEASRRRIADVAATQGWRTSPENPGFDVAARVLDDFSAIGFEPSDEYLGAYAAAAGVIARADLSALLERGSPALIAELMIVGTVVGDALIAGLRRLAHQDATAELFPVPDQAPTPNPTPHERSKEQP
jgi:hypothetical protein